MGADGTPGIGVHQGHMQTPRIGRACLADVQSFG